MLEEVLASGAAEATVATGPGSVALLAIVQGLTEFLPVSSSGHLVLTREALGLSELSLLLDVAVHVGTLLAVLLVYREHLFGLVADLFRGRLREVGLILLGSLPAGLVGFGLKDVFERVFTEGRNAAYGLLVTALLLFVSDVLRRRRAAATARRASSEAPLTPEPAASEGTEVPSPSAGRRELNWADALVVGSAQAVAIWPGVSRSGSTISAGLLRGLAADVAARFSFLLSIPVIAGAALLQALDAAEAGLGSLTPGLILMAVGLAGGVGWVALKLLLAVLERGAFRWFAAYTALLGIGYLVFL